MESCNAGNSRRPYWMSVAGIIALIFVLGIAAVPGLFSNEQSLDWLVHIFVPELEAHVRCDRVQLRWFSPVVLEGIRIEFGEGIADPIRIKRIEGTRGVAGILTSMGNLGRFRIEGLEANVLFDDARGSRLTSLIEERAKSSNESGNELVSKPRKSFVSTQIEVNDAIVRLSGPWTDVTWISNPIDISASLAPSAKGPYSEWTIEPVQLLTHAKLEASVAQGVLAYIAPVLAGAARTTGEFSLRLDGARLPVGQPGSGELSGMLQMHEVDIAAGPLVSQLLAALANKIQLPDSIRVTDDSNVMFQLANRRVSHEGLSFGIPVDSKRLDIHSAGSVGLEDHSLDLTLTLPIPEQISQERPLLAKFAGSSIGVHIGGKLGEPTVDFDGTLRGMGGNVGNLLGELLEKVRRPNAEGGSSVPQPSRGVAGTNDSPEEENAKEKTAGGSTTEAVIDLVGGLLDEVAKRRAEKRAANQPSTAEPKPQRSRLLRRLDPASDTKTDQP